MSKVNSCAVACVDLHQSVVSAVYSSCRVLVIEKMFAGSAHSNLAQQAAALYSAGPLKSITASIPRSETLKARVVDLLRGSFGIENWFRGGKSCHDQADAILKARKQPPGCGRDSSSTTALTKPLTGEDLLLIEKHSMSIFNRFIKLVSMMPLAIRPRGGFSAALSAI